MVNEPPSPERRQEDWQRHPEDFELLEVGEWESNDNEWTLHKSPVQLLALSTLKG